MKKKLLLFITALIALLVLAGCSGDPTRTDAAFKDVTQSGMLAQANLTHNFGDINIMGGNVSHDFILKNEGDKDLILKGGETSCMCTTAIMLLPDGGKSPQFGMHNNPTNWVYAIKPGEEFTVQAIYDPLAHGPNGTGSIQRGIQIETSAKNMPMVDLKILANVLSQEDYNSKY